MTMKRRNLGDGGSVRECDDLSGIDHAKQIINGKPVLTVQQVQAWLMMSDEAAAGIAVMLNTLEFDKLAWHPNYKSKRQENESASRWRRIFGALSQLEIDLPEAISECRRVQPDADVPDFEALLKMATKWTPALYKFASKGQGNKRDLANNAAINIGSKAKQAYEQDNPGKELDMTLLDAFVAEAMGWLGVRKTDQTWRKVRTRGRSGQK
jgi:hypothetical protein